VANDPKQTKLGENNAVIEATAPEAKAAASDMGENHVKATAAELNPNPTKSTENNAVTDATAPMAENSEVMATAPDSIPAVIATQGNEFSASQDKLSQPPSVDQMVQELKKMLVKEKQSSNAPAEVTVEPAMVSLSALSATTPSPGPKAEKKRPATQYAPRPGLTTDKNLATTQSSPSPDPTKKKSPLAAVADQLNFDALFGMDSLSKAAYHRTLLRYPKYTQAYLDHAYNIVHDFQKCDIRVLHVIDPKEGVAVQEDEEKKDSAPEINTKTGEAVLDEEANKVGEPDPSKKLVEIGSPNSNQKDSPSNVMEIGFLPTANAIEGVVQDEEEKKVGEPDPAKKPVEIGSPKSNQTDSSSNEMVIGFPPTLDEMVYVEDDCLKYVHAFGQLDISCDFEAVDELVLLNLTRPSFQYTDYFDLIHDFKKFFTKWLTVDILQFYECWVSRSIGSYPENIFLLPLDYYQANVEDIFESYWRGTEPVVKGLVERMRRYVHPPVTYNTRST
jgi:hypothetical protein